MTIRTQDRDILRGLAEKVAKIASLPVQTERKQLWKNFNALKPRRPMVLAFPEFGWRELILESRLQCTDPLAREWEDRLLGIIFRHEQIGDDYPITNVFKIVHLIDPEDYGLREKTVGPMEKDGKPEVTQWPRALSNSDHAFAWEAPLKELDDIEKMRCYTLRVNRSETERRLNLAREIFDGFLEVRLDWKAWWSVGLTRNLIFLRGLEQAMIDIYENPEWLGRLMAFLRDSRLYELKQHEEQQLLTLNSGTNDYVGSGGIGCIDELPARDHNGVIRPIDMWVLGESQEFVNVNPRQFFEFSLHYELPILNQFGLVCYGCCEPLDRERFDMIIRHIPKLRRVSVSPWCDRKLAAEKLQDKYIFSWKPNPTDLATGTVRWDHIENNIRETLGLAEGCCLEMIMKDNHTFRGDPTRIGKWVTLAKRMVNA